ncbi:hypothetical protein QVD17_05595 [Tagetes erecta]|uniref:Uncharacterized protein n=1 Tax=Tagetes erecta TaxID=13708 RepID=A0AAD8LCB5_TARER|nr:hypothetical protein QVD17_05595 [Tagetes erecta]
MVTLIYIQALIQLFLYVLLINIHNTGTHKVIGDLNVLLDWFDGAVQMVNTSAPTTTPCSIIFMTTQPWQAKEMLMYIHTSDQSFSPAFALSPPSSDVRNFPIFIF